MLTFAQTNWEAHDNTSLSKLKSNLKGFSTKWHSSLNWLIECQKGRSCTCQSLKKNIIKINRILIFFCYVIFTKPLHRLYTWGVMAAWNGVSLHVLRGWDTGLAHTRLWIQIVVMDSWHGIVGKILLCTTASPHPGVKRVIWSVIDYGVPNFLHTGVWPDRSKKSTCQ